MELRSVIVSLGIFVFFLLVGLKLDGHLDGWSWWQVFSPVWLMFSMISYMMLLVSFRMLRSHSFLRSFTNFFLHSLCILPLVIYALLLCSKLHGNLDASYNEIFTPIYIFIGVAYLIICASSTGSS